VFHHVIEVQMRAQHIGEICAAGKPALVKILHGEGVCTLITLEITLPVVDDAGVDRG